MSFSRKEVLSIWEEHHGALDAHWISVFLNDERTKYLTRLHPRAVRRALELYRKLDAVLEAASCRQQEISEISAPTRRSRNSNDRSRYSGGHFPHRPADSELHRQIGPTQKYSDDL